MNYLHDYTLILYIILFSSLLITCNKDESESTQSSLTCIVNLDCEASHQCVEGQCRVTDRIDLINTREDCTPYEEVCDQLDNDCDGMIDEKVSNACGGCSTEMYELGSSCECEGVWGCELQSFVCQGGSPTNICGGCDMLTNTVNMDCGECGGGRWQCNESQQLECQGAITRNECGGCIIFANPVGTECGTCGRWECNGTDTVICNDLPMNACGNCRVLDGEPGESCGTCGTWACNEQGRVLCSESDPSLCTVTRWIAMGDTGEANEAQYRVSASAQARCDRAGGCNGFLMLGDNIYDAGASSPFDQELTTKIDLPYANLKLGPPPAEGEPDQRDRMPIYASLGNHDLGGAGINSAQVQHYLSYSNFNSWFYYPSEFWELKVGNVHLVSIHTNPLAYGIPADLFQPQADMIQRVIEQGNAPWIVVFGHHPYRSNGRHGNAGAYEGLPIEIDLFGAGFRDWVESELCNHVDFYLSGHDHNRQWLASTPLIPSYPEGQGSTPCRTNFAVSGAGSKTTDFENRGNSVLFEDDQKEGFLFLEFHQDFVNVEFCDSDGQVDWSHQIRKPQ
jgi:tartrate-resistant acid phosphatase type 5